MNRRRWLVTGAVIGLLASASPEAARGNGNNDNNGDNGSAEVQSAAKTFAELQSLVADPKGPKEIVIGGELRGDLVIKRPLVLRGAPNKGVTLTGTGASTVIAIENTEDVTLENILVRQSGRRQTTEDAGIKAKDSKRVRIQNVKVEETLFGISLLACHECLLEKSHVIGWGDDTELRGDGIKLWESHDSIVRGCTVEHSRDVVVWYTRRATLEDNYVTGSRYGSHFMYAHDSHVRRSRFEKNVVGIFVMYSMRLEVEDNVVAGARGAAGIGIGFKDSDAVRVKGNWLVGNTTGTYLDNTPRIPSEEVHFDKNIFALNDVALGIHSSEKGVIFRGNGFENNAYMLEADGGGDGLAIDMRGNHFTDYEGYDLNGDGIGDVPFELKGLSSELTDSRPVLRFFHGTAVMSVIDAVARAVPVLASRKMLTDPAPLMRSPAPSQPPHSFNNSTPAPRR